MLAYATLTSALSGRRLGEGRSMGASGIEKATSNVKKEVRGHAGQALSSVERAADRDTAAAASAALSAAPFATTTPQTSDLTPQASSSAPKREFTATEKTACSIEAMKNGEECEACQ